MSGALEARGIPTFPNKLNGEFEGIISAPDGVLKITKIRGHFDVTVPKGKVEAAKRALTVFDRGCPVSQTLKGCVEFEFDWNITEVEEE